MKSSPALLIILVLCTPFVANAQKVQPVDAAWFDEPRNLEVAVSAQLISAGDPLTAVMIRSYGIKEVVWAEFPFAPETAPPLNAKWLRKVRDRGPIPSVGLIKDFSDYPSAFKVYARAVINSFELPLDAFKKSAMENKDIQFSHLYERPRENRGKVIKITGQLRRLRRFPAPTYIQQKTLLPHLYEGWIYGPTRGAYPYCVLFVNKPDGVKLGEKIDYHVEFYGYFFKLYRYVDGKHKTRDTPLFIGPTVVVMEAPAPPPEDAVPPIFSLQMLIVIVAFTAAVAALVGAMSFFYRRADRRVRMQIEQTKAARAIEMIEQGTVSSVEVSDNSDGAFFTEKPSDEQSPAEG